MAAAGVSINRSITVAGSRPAEVGQRLVMSMGRGGEYQSASVGSDTYQFVRTFRPRWALVTGSLGTVLLLGGGLLFFLVKKTESCTMSVTAGPNGSLVVVSGRLLSGRFEALQAELTGSVVADHASPATELVDIDLSEVELDHTGGSDDLLPGVAARASFVSPDASSAVAGPVRDDSALDHPALDHTVLLQRPASVAAAVTPLPALRPAPVLVFDTGIRVPLTSTLLVGRDPAARADVGAVRLVPLPDEGRSISKTHFAVGLGDDGVWIEDLHSTNGTVIIESTGRHVQLVAGQRALVSFGAVVAFGDRRVEFVYE